jgi:hypothetical protein
LGKQENGKQTNTHTHTTKKILNEQNERAAKNGLVYCVQRHFQEYFSYILTSVLLVEEFGLPRENRRPVANHCRATLNDDDVRDFIDAYLLDIKHHKHEKNTLVTGK